MHGAVKEAAEYAIRDYGTGGTSSRLLAGTCKLHVDLESELARFLAKEAALVFSSGYHANTGLLPALAGPGDVLFVDRLCHASIIDGMKLSGARFYTFEHNNLDEAEQLLREKRPEYKRAIIVTEGVFSMDGDKPDLKRLCAIAHANDTLVYIDEAHSLGLFGLSGRGVASEQNVLDQIDIFVGTLSKSLGSQGGFVASRKSLIDYLVTKTRSFIYTTALAPASAAAALAALRLLPVMESRRTFVLKTAAAAAAKLRERGFKVMSANSQIIPVWTGSLEATQKLSEHLFAQGFFVPSIRPPTVPANEGRVRLSITLEVAERGIENLIRAFENSVVETH
jgi:8-amino-7-oxononanoate synthase